MVRLRFVVLATTLAAYLGFSAPAINAQRETRATPTGLVLEVTFFAGKPPAYQPVPGPESNASGSWYAMFRRIPAWQPPVESLPVSAVKVLSRVDGEAIRVTVSLLLGARFHEKEQPVASYLIRTGEKKIVRELTEFGLEPFVIKAFRRTPTIADPPAVRSNAESIAVIGTEVLRSTLPTFKIKLQNLSGKDVLALGVEIFVNNRRRISGMPQGKEGQPLIAAGTAYELVQRIAQDARPTSEGYEPGSSGNQEVIISTAVYQDGSFEGDAVTAARFRAFSLGRKIQIEKLVDIIREALASSDIIGPSAIEDFKARVSALTSDADVSLVDDLVRDVPALTQQEKTDLKGAVDIASNGIKTDLLKEIQSFLEPQPARPALFQQWLNRKSKSYEGWLSTLSAVRTDR